MFRKIGEADFCKNCRVYIHLLCLLFFVPYNKHIGATVNFKTYTKSIWDKKQRENPEENQRIFYNTHPAIIKQEVFDKVQEIRQQR
ncbi:MAG: recombinase family protein, partial [Oscillospiraceae bacterium]|nr:recombinase family protein [Oscillospiraceae bacterium]